ncbi:AAC(3) family N-acetyltransferase [Vibrio sp. ZSDZ34]|uniref:Aminoglycoside N(3)-acetyltransferase n=1 Tax=Vibrio gelatinilyticus TaxID=2893468 RepID=A0A9X2AVY4_9VIBR|nr:AAC(3) family N-acetyltransferase [Vibrio gelatinilyticus]MCJ2376825.1 AAC(3) family N-acetyltransferase [Vibrio gelatinilyticus]
MSMTDKQALIDDLFALGIEPTGTLLVHSSMKAIGDVEGRADTVLDALSDVMQDGLLLLPTHSWADDNLTSGVFDPDKEPSCVGVLTNLFRQRTGVVRSLHPTHSVAALGRNAAEFIEGEETCTTPCPRDGVWGRLYDVDAQILLLGCDLTSNTFIHGVEEWHPVKNRIARKSQVIRIKKGHQIIESELHRHQSPNRSIHKNYDKLEQPFLKTGVGHWGMVAQAPSFIASAKGMADLTESFLKRNPDIFLDRTPIPSQWYEKRI